MNIPAEARMGNDIARQFAHLPTPEAVKAISYHIETFWDPRMRRALDDLAAAHDDALDPLLADAAAHMAESQATRSEPGSHP